MGSAAIMPGAEPFAFDGGSTGVLLVHGFTGSPQGMREWGEYLAAAGHTVICPRLPGHGTQPKDLHDTTPAEWVAEAERGLRGLTERCANVFVFGLSMGGAITLDLAQRFGSDIAGIALVNPFLYSKDPRVKLAPLVGKFPLLLKGVYDDVAEPGRHELGYEKVSTKASAALLVYGRGIQSRLAQVTVPALIFTSRQDHVVHPGNSSLVLETISSTDKEQVWLERSYHVATLDYDRHLIFERSAKFVAEHEDA